MHVASCVTERHCKDQEANFDVSIRYVTSVTRCYPREQSVGAYRTCTGPKVDKGFGVLEWTGKLVPQGLLVKGTPRQKALVLRKQYILQ